MASEPKKQSSIPLKCPKCSRWLPKGSQRHRCVPPTEREVVGHLAGDLLVAWQRLRGFAAGLGPQRIYASGKAVMFSRGVCYLFLKTRKSSLELCLFLPERVEHSWVKSVRAVSRTKFAHTILVAHEDQVEGPLTGWIQTAWDHLDPK